MTPSLTHDQIKNFRDQFESQTQNKMVRNALSRAKIEDVAMNWDAFSTINHTYSDAVKKEMEVTNQKQSGRCWGFAGLNLMRLALGEKYNIEKFEFSQNYFIFWDKLEKSNYFLENILNTLDEDLESRIIMFLLTDPIQDGGQWDMFVNLIEKYGLVPQTVMPESQQSSYTRDLNRLLTRKLREFAFKLREANSAGQSISELRKLKPEMMQTVYNMLCMFLGTPPKVFDWQIRDKDKKFKRFTGLTPLKFYKEQVGTNLRDKICLINAPMRNKKYDTLYTVKFLGNVMEGEIVKYINLPSDKLKSYAINSIQNNEAVWFGCDVGKMYHQKLGVMDMDLYNYPLVLNTEFSMDKCSRLEYGDSMMTHAMLFTAVDIQNDKSTKWRVENSWGDKVGDKGYFLMTDNWFDEYLYEIVIDKKYLSEDLIKLYDTTPVELAPWDPMGALAIRKGKL